MGGEPLVRRSPMIFTMRRKSLNESKNMITAILPSIVAFAIVATYMTIVHRMLRTDEHWHESDVSKRAVKPQATATCVVTAVAAHA
jgi:hypothetical protein